MLALSGVQLCCHQKLWRASHRNCGRRATQQLFNRSSVAPSQLCEGATGIVFVQKTLFLPSILRNPIHINACVPSPAKGKGVKPPRMSSLPVLTDTHRAFLQLVMVRHVCVLIHIFLYD